jgi:glycosyltransferase involved in cell wall biosynthesis
VHGILGTRHLYWNLFRHRLEEDGFRVEEVALPFVLHVGDLHERRNLPTVVDAVLGARRHFGNACAVSLVLAGIDRGVGDGLCAIAAEADQPDAVVRLGPVSDAMLLALYQCATALVYPSLYEGFGLPVLEAMACGTPVIASRAASIPEVAGDAGILLDPLDVNGWTEAIVNVLNDDDRRAQMRSRGLARASEFTWARTARLTLDVFRQVARAR